MFIIQIIYNIGFLISLSILSIFLDKKFDRNSHLGQIVQGTLFGIVTVLGMMNPFILSQGLIFDGRTIVLSLVSLFFGGFAGIIAGTIALIYRLIIGGSGLYMGIWNIAVPVLVGWLYFKILKKQSKKINEGRLYLMGLVVHILFILSIILLPSNFSHIVFATVSLTVLVVYPVGTVIIGKILLVEQENYSFIKYLKNEKDNLTITINSIGDGVIATDYDGNVVLMNPVAEKLTGWKLNEAFGKPLSSIFHIINAFTRQAVENPVNRVIQTGKIIGLANHTVLINRNGTEFQIADSAAPIIDNLGSINGIVLVFSNVTDKYIIQEKLKESEFVFRRLFEASVDPILLLNDNGFIDCNEATLKLLGYENKNDLLNKQPWEISPELQPDGTPSFNKAIQMIRKALDEGYNIFEWVHNKKNGEEVIVDVMLTPIILDGKQLFYTTWRDITNRKKAEIELRESEQKFRDIFEKHSAMKFLIEADTGNIVDVNEAAIKFYGYTYKQFLKMNIADINTLPQEQIYSKMSLVQKGQKNNFEFKHRLANGKVVDVQVFSSTIKIKDKNYLHSIITDISDRKEAEKNLKLLHQAVEQNPAIIVITDVNGKIQYVNPKFTEITGYTFEEAYEQKPNLLKSGIYTTEFYEDLWGTILAGNIWQKEIMNKKKDGTFYWENVLISPILDEENNIVNFIKIGEDVTEKKKIIEEVIFAKQQAEESERLKTAFLQNMSHEIRTPLNGIIGFANLLNQKDLSTKDIYEFTSIIQTSSKRLLEIVNNVLDMSKIQTGQIKINETTFSLNSLFHTMFSLFQLIAEEKGIKLKFSTYLADTLSRIISDETKVHQILSNLINNAIKFTKKGEVEFGYEIKGQYIQFYVKDTGIGIPPEMQEKIFERFVQAEMGVTREFEGAGLGLSICKGLVELLGGKIWLVSELNKGTTFYFTLPYKTNNEKNETENISEQINMDNKLAKTVLIVEDDFTSYLYLRIILEDMGINSLYAPDGKDAIEIIKTTKDIALILMDIRMPIVNGLEATKQIKAINPAIPIIAQTAYAYSEEKEKVLAIGCDDYLAKPIEKETLEKMMKKYLQ